MEKLEVLVTVKIYPIPSAKYDELSCTAGVNEDGEFIRLYPINYRDLPWDQQFKRYQWIEVMAEKHTGRDFRKESWRRDSTTVQLTGEPIPTGRGGDWSERGKYVLKHVAASMEDLRDRQEADGASLGMISMRGQPVQRPQDDERGLGGRGTLLESRRRGRNARGGCCEGQAEVPRRDLRSRTRNLLLRWDRPELSEILARPRRLLAPEG